MSTITIDRDTATLAVLTVLECELSTWTGTIGQCRWCDTELTGRQTAWCSGECQWEFEVNHTWRFARHSAK